MYYRILIDILCTVCDLLSVLQVPYMAQNFDGENIDEFDEFPAIRQYFPYQNFPFS